MQVRNGNPHALDFYTTHDRIHAGTNTTMLDQAYQGWTADTTAGTDSLLIASTRREVSALNRRAHTDRVGSGSVDPHGTELHDGTTAGVGDLIVTRRNDRRLTTRNGTRFVRNGDTWKIVQRHPDGDLTVQHQTNHSQIRLPAEYVSRHVDLGYATTTALAQGRTVDTTHALIDATATRETLYVAATRGRTTNHLYVTNQQQLDLDAEHPPAPDLVPTTS
jgi:ATP-dependent exoDNAse (exonuclease V) alpha subunit